MQKQGQITLFIIISIVILIIVGASFIAYRSITEKPESLLMQAQFQDTVQSIESFMRSCVDLISKDGIKIVAGQGGFYPLPDLHAEIDGRSVAYQFYNGESRTPTLKDIEKAIGRYAQNNLPSCFNDFKTFRERGIEIEYKIIDPRVTIGKDFVTLQISVPTKINAGSSSATLNDFVTKVNVPLYSFYITVNRLVDLMVQRNALPLSEIVNRGIEQDTSARLLQEEQDIIILLTDTKPVVNEFEQALPEPRFVYAFGARFLWE